MTNAGNRRRIPNIMVDRPALLRLSLPFLALIAISFSIVFEIRERVLKALEGVSLQGAENLPAMNALLDLQRSITSIALSGMVILSFFCFLIWLRLTHRVFGPTVPMRNQVRKLAEGDYSARIRLRKGDEFQALTAELNALAMVLEEKSKS